LTAYLNCFYAEPALSQVKQPYVDGISLLHLRKT